jgi:hypothetical protein
MGTNYYLRFQECEHCGHTPQEVHLGKSSLGWTFGLHIIPECEIIDLPSMEKWVKEKLATSQACICNEYGITLSWQDFLEIVTIRSCPRIIKDGWNSRWWDYGIGLGRLSYSSETDFHRKNSSTRGPSGLLRHRIDGYHCVGHGAGTWDLCIGEFS